MKRFYLLTCDGIFFSFFAILLNSFPIAFGYLLAMNRNRDVCRSGVIAVFVDKIFFASFLPISEGSAMASFGIPKGLADFVWVSGGCMVLTRMPKRENSRDNVLLRASIAPF